MSYTSLHVDARTLQLCMHTASKRSIQLAHTLLPLISCLSLDEEHKLRLWYLPKTLMLISVHYIGNATAKGRAGGMSG